MQIVHHPQHPQLRPANEADVTRWLVNAIAHELWGLYGVAGTLDWAGAERGLDRIVQQARIDVRESRTPRVAAEVPAKAPTDNVGHRGRTKRAAVWRPEGDVGPLLEPRRQTTGTG